MKYLLAFFILLCAPAVANAALLTPGAPQSVSVGEVFPVSFLVDSEGSSINVVSGALAYPTNRLQFVSIAKTESFLSLWPEEPRVDEQRGIITFAGGTPNGTVAYHVPAVTVQFRAKTIGDATISIDGAASDVKLNDGYGSSASLTTSDATISISNADPLTPRLLSPTHPRQDQWSALRDAIITWDESPMLLTSFQLSRDGQSEPDDIQEDVQGRVSYPSLTDGIWYFTLKQKFAGPEAWGPVARWTFRIDGTVPSTPYLEVLREGNEVFAAFSATDNLSGIDHIDIRFLKPRFAWFPFFSSAKWVTMSSPLRLGHDPLFQSISVRAVDEAGNASFHSYQNPDYRTHQFRFWLQVIVTTLAVTILPMLFVERRRRRR